MMSDNKREPKPETKPQLPFFATDPAEKPATARTGVRAGATAKESAMKRR
jgi:hypothetical protein